MMALDLFKSFYFEIDRIKSNIAQLVEMDKSKFEQEK